MVYASMQGKNEDNKRVTAVNGKLLIAGEEENKILLDIAKKLSTRRLDFSGMIRNLNRFERYCYLNHPEPDDIGRPRKTLIIWNKNESEENIRKTLESIGINNFNEWELANEKYLKKDFQKKIIIGIGIVAITIIAITIIKG